MDIGLDNYREARTCKLQNWSNWCSGSGVVQVTGSASSHGRKVKAGTVKKIPVAFIGQNKVFQENQANTVTLNDSRNFRGSLLSVHITL